MKKTISILLAAFIAAGAFAAVPKIDAAAAKKSFKNTVTVTPQDKTVTITKNKITIAPKSENITYTISGYFNGQIVSKTKNTVIKLENAYLENTSGEAALFSEAKMEVSAAKDSTNYVVSSGKSSAKTAAIQSKKGLVIGGSGTLYAVGNVMHGAKGDTVKIKGSGTFYFQGTKDGSALSCDDLEIASEKTFKAYFLNSKNGIKADGEIKIASGEFFFYDNKTALKTDTKKDDPKNPHGITLSGGTFHTSDNKKLYSTEQNAYKADGAKIKEE